jgi:hypothetical protein
MESQVNCGFQENGKNWEEAWKPTLGRKNLCQLQGHHSPSEQHGLGAVSTKLRCTVHLTIDVLEVQSL